MKRFGFLALTMVLAIAVCYAILPDLFAPAVNLLTATPAHDLVAPTLAMAAFGTYDYWHPIRSLHKHDTSAVPNFILAATSVDFPNGVIGAPMPASGLVKLFVFESLRAQCQGSSDPKLQLLATQIPSLWAFDGLLDDTTVTLDDAQKFNIATNCSNAQILSGYAQYQPVTLNTPDPTHHRGWIAGDSVANAGALPTRATLNDLPAIAQAILVRSALQL